MVASPAQAWVVLIPWSEPSSVGGCSGCGGAYRSRTYSSKPLTSGKMRLSKMGRVVCDTPR